LQAWRKKISNAKKFPENPNDLPKTMDACDTKIGKTQEQIDKLEFNFQDKKDNSEVSLGTSKINYMDPRITISWSKRNEVPIEKLFPKTLLKKFAWAMSNDPEWNF
jgi:DNA topoisomerase I